MKSNWKTITIGEVAEKIAMGPFGSNIKVSTFVKKGIPIISGQHLRGSRLLDHGFNFITSEHANRLRNSIVHRGDVIFTHAGNIGQVSLIPKNSEYEEYIISQRQFYLRCDRKKLDPLFATYYFHSRIGQHQLLANRSQTGVPSIARPSTHLKSIEILLPPLDEQRSIAAVLSSLDDKIELLRSQNKTLEEMARALFSKWFVEDAGVDWERGRLVDILDINPTYKLQKGSVAPYLEMSNLRSDSFAPSGWRDRKFTSGMKFMNGDTLFARITPCLENGKTSFVDFLNSGQVGWGSTEYIVMRSKEYLHPLLSYVIAKTEGFRDFAMRSMTGSSGRQRAQADVLETYQLAIPPQEILDVMNYEFEIITLKLSNNSKQIRTLESLRETVLPKLIGGEIIL